MIEWVNDYLNKEFSSGSTMDKDALEWMSASRTWWTRFCTQIGATNLDFRKNHYEWSLSFLYKGQWWYCSSGDVRFKICKDMLIRTMRHSKDWTGGRNQYVPYEGAFTGNLLRILYDG
jgi:hypothetical protein